MTQATGRLIATFAARVGRLTIDVEIDTGPGTLVVVGPNGAGKSSLLSLLLGALPADEGRVTIGETVLYDSASSRDLPVEQRRIGYVPQDYALFPHQTVRGNIEFALASAPSGRAMARTERTSRVDQLLAELGIAHLAGRRPQTLSGGEKQRVALARALSVSPRALLLDEPLAALDVASRHQVRSFLAGTLATLALPTVVVTHDAADARALGQHVAVLEAGTITQRGTFDQLAARPASPFVERFTSTAD